MSLIILDIRKITHSFIVHLKTSRFSYLLLTSISFLFIYVNFKLLPFQQQSEMPLRMEPGQVYKTWADFRDALDAHCDENKCLFNISNAKTVEQANRALKKRPFFDIALKYASCILVCKHYGSYTSSSKGARPNQR